jgi:hypothetical protein
VVLIYALTWCNKNKERSVVLINGNWWVLCEEEAGILVGRGFAGKK